MKLTMNIQEYIEHRRRIIHGQYNEFSKSQQDKLLIAKGGAYLELDILEDAIKKGIIEKNIL